MTLEEAYREDVREIARSHKPGTEERRRLKRRRWEKYEADVFERDGKPAILWRLQERFGRSIFAQLVALYGGEITPDTYRGRKIGAAQRYADRLVELGLMTDGFDYAWVRDRVRDVIRAEREALPLHTNGFSPDDAATICDRSIGDAKKFFRALHLRFGLGRLRANPDIFGGIDPTLCESEKRNPGSARIP